MNNQTKIILSVQGIEGRTFKFSGKSKINWSLTKKDIYPSYKGKDKDKVVSRGTSEIKVYENVPAKQTIKMTQEAYDCFTSSACPEWYYKKGEWKNMKPDKRLELHLKRICESLGGTEFTYSILED